MPCAELLLWAAACGGIGGGGADGESGDESRGRRTAEANDSCAADSIDEGRNNPPRPGTGRRLFAHIKLLRSRRRGPGLRAVRFVPIAAEGVCGEWSERSDSVC